MATLDASTVEEALTHVLQEQRQRFGGGQRGEDEAIALQYALNAARSAAEQWDAAGNDGVALAEAVAEAIREASRLYRADRDDEEGFGFAMMIEVVRELGRRLGLELDPDAPVFQVVHGRLGTEFAVHRWSPGYVRSEFEALSDHEQIAFRARARRFASYTRGLLPTEMDHEWFLAWCWAISDDWSRALEHVGRAFEAGEVLLTATKNAPGTLGWAFHSADLLSRELASLALERLPEGEARRKLVDAHAVIAAACWGAGSEAHMAALALAEE